MRPWIVKMTWSHPKMPFPQRVLILIGSVSPSNFERDFQFCWSRMFIPDPRSRIQIFSFLDPGSKFFPSWIPDPNFFHPDLGSGIRIKEFKHFNNKKMVFSALRNMIRVFHPRSRSWLFTHPGSRSWIPDPESRGQNGTGSRIRIRNTRDFGLAQAVGGRVGYWLSTGAPVLTTHSKDQLSEAFMCKKKNSPYISFKHYPYLSYFYRF